MAAHDTDLRVNVRVNFTINTVIVTVAIVGSISRSISGVGRSTSSIPARRQLQPRFFFLFSDNSWTVKSATVGAVVLVTSTPPAAALKAHLERCRGVDVGLFRRTRVAYRGDQTSRNRRYVTDNLWYFHLTPDAR